MTDWLIVLTIGLPWLGALAVWLTGDDRPDQQHRLAVIFSVLAGLAALLLIPSAGDTVALRIEVGSVFGDFTFVPDGLGVFLAAVATVIGCLAVIFSVDYMHGEKQLGRFYSFVLLFIGAMVGLVLTDSILLLFVFWEITALTSYALISFYNDDPKAVEGGIKALVITSFGGVGMLVGGLIVYAYLGDYQISTLLSRADELPSGVLAALAFGFLIAAAAKSAQVPFHTWLPGAMEAPTPVSALIHAATMVNAGVYVLARFYPAFEGVSGWTTAVTLVGLVSALMAALMALVATDLKRVLAYSTISQLGYMVYAVGVGDIFASQFHLLSHAVFKALLFLSAGAVIHSVGTRDMREMGGLGKKMPFIRNVFVVGALALAGLPVLNGFWSKELILEGGLHDGPIWAYIGMLVGAGITALYTFRMVWLVFYGTPRAKLHVHPAGQMMRLSTGILAAGTATTWLLAGLFGELLENTLPFHHLHVEAGTALLGDVIAAPATYLALGVVALGLLAWQYRDALGGLVTSLRPIGDAAAADFGFEWINRRVVQWATTAGESLRAFQTGSVNWNVAGIVGALIVVLVILALGA
ncbi:NADH-quinone oxidoreductase subunit 5 family protein [Aggregatilinea lenta]|uniref:NADH-quinone oxidoreductase subunit 5 family protein n=1 Tax=Aggregatilinea lenta TaxID=913108 RepID=UPI000E5BB14A|nr:NADH-quinone oxidoreductase subunit L [Aggregatilinea lenta]